MRENLPRVVWVQEEAMKRGVWAVFVLIVAACSGQVGAQAGWNDDVQAEARELIGRLLRPYGSRPQNAPALSIALAIDGTMVWGAGFGEIAPGKPANADTVYRIGSLTKQFTAAGLLSLVERGALSSLTGKSLQLDAPASDYLGGLEHWSVEGQSPVTIRSLLNMTSNLPNYTRRPPDGLDPWGTVASQDLLMAVKRFRPKGWPGSFEYSNTSYFVLSEIAASVRLPGRAEANGDFHSYLREAIFARAEMMSTGFSGDRDLEDRLPPASYRRKPVFSSPDWLRGSADMLSTVRDLYSWNRALMSGAVLAPGSLDEMFREAGRVTPTSYYGMGWFVVPGQTWTHYSHTGSVAGFTACNAIAQSRDRKKWISVTLLSNSDGVDGLEQLADDILQLIERD